MIYPLFFALLIGFACLYIFIGKRSSTEIKNGEDYFLSSRNLGSFSLALTLLATQLGGGSLQGAAGEAYMKGWIVLFYPAGMCLGLMVLSLGFGSRLRKLGLNTIVELFEKVYGSLRLKRFASLISVITMFFILVGQGVAVRKFFGYLGFDSFLMFLGFWLVIVIYTVVGGLKAVVRTDIVQTLFILATFVAVFITSQMGLSGGQVLLSSKASFQEGVPWIAWLLMPLLFMLIEQDMGQRCFAARKSKSIFFAGTIASILLMLCSTFAIYFGILASKLGLEISTGKDILMTIVAEMTNPIITTFFACGFLMVILSTADSLLCSIASNLCFDFPFCKNMDAKNKVVLSQIITFVVGISAMGCSSLFTNILPVLIQSYEFSVSVLFVPIIMAFFSTRLPVRAAVSSMVIGIGGFITFRFCSCPIPKEVAVLILSYIGFGVGQYMDISQRRRVLKQEVRCKCKEVK